MISTHSKRIMTLNITDVNTECCNESNYLVNVVIEIPTSAAECYIKM